MEPTPLLAAELFSQAPSQKSSTREYQGVVPSLTPRCQQEGVARCRNLSWPMRHVRTDHVTYLKIGGA